MTHNLLVREDTSKPWRVYGQLLKGASLSDCEQSAKHLPPDWDWAVVRVVSRKNDAKVSWQDKVTAEKARLGRDPTLDELLILAQTHVMTPAEIEMQRKSWAAQDMD